MIRAVLVDFAGTMTESVQPAFHELARHSGADPAELAEMVLGGSDPDAPWCRFERGEITLAEIIDWGREQGAARGWDIDFGPFVHSVIAMPIRAGLTERLRTLRAAGYRTALVTNNARELADLWPRMFPVDELFDVVIDSSAVGTRKPEPQIFEITLQRLDVEPHEALLLDDLPLNIDAAQALGIQGVLVQADPAGAYAQLDCLLDAPPVRGVSA